MHTYSLHACGTRSGVSTGAVLLAALVIVAVVAALYIASGPAASGTVPTRHVVYIANVSDQKLDQTTNYNAFNVLKDGVIVVAATIGLGACVGGTFGACAVAAPGVGAIINGALQDPIITTDADFQFTNSGNGTATSITYEVATYTDGNLLQASLYSIPALGAGETTTVEYAHAITFGDLPVSLWNFIQGKGNVDIQVANMTYDGGS